MVIKGLCLDYIKIQYLFILFKIPRMSNVLLFISSVLTYLSSVKSTYSLPKNFWDKSSIHQKEFIPDSQKILKILKTYSLKPHDVKNVQDVKFALSFKWSIFGTYSFKNKWNSG